MNELEVPKSHFNTPLNSVTMFGLSKEESRTAAVAHLSQCQSITFTTPSLLSTSPPHIFQLSYQRLNVNQSYSDTTSMSFLFLFSFYIIYIIQ